jgi:hypothetical protein
MVRNSTNYGEYFPHNCFHVFLSKLVPKILWKKIDCFSRKIGRKIKTWSNDFEVAKSLSLLIYHKFRSCRSMFKFLAMKICWKFKDCKDICRFPQIFLTRNNILLKVKGFPLRTTNLGVVYRSTTPGFDIFFTIIFIWKLKRIDCKHLHYLTIF